MDDDEGPGTTRWFGPSWGAPVCDPRTHIDTPLLIQCIVCDEWFHFGDQGITTPASLSLSPMGYVGYHLHCFLREIGVPDGPGVP
jgi:hypothetical protein